jgi:hypothetical protein
MTHMGMRARKHRKVDMYKFCFNQPNLLTLYFFLNAEPIWLKKENQVYRCMYIFAVHTYRVF